MISNELTQIYIWVLGGNYWAEPGRRYVKRCSDRDDIKISAVFSPIVLSKGIQLRCHFTRKSRMIGWVLKIVAKIKAK